MHKHAHKAIRETTIGYRGTAAGAIENRRAHGGVCFIERCACGARRETNSNGNFVERGKWIAE